MSKTIFRKVIVGICLTSLLMTFSDSFTKQALADDEKEGLPGRRVGGGTRSGALLPVTALVPENDLGLTIVENPTFFFYIPKTPSPQIVEFVLNDETGDTVYEKKFTTDGNSGVVGIRLPGDSQIKPMQVGKNYRWYFAIVPNVNDRSNDIYVTGWIKRVQFSPNLVSQLKGKDPLARAGAYAANNLWYDALATIAELRRSRPNDPAVEAKWKQLLESVNLEKIAQEPLIESQAPVQQEAGVKSQSKSL